MIKYILVILSIVLFTNCNSQTKENTVMKKNLTPPFNQINEGELNINFDTLMASEVGKIKTAIDLYNYNYPDPTLFKNKIKDYFNFDLDAYGNNIVVLQYSLTPEIAIKELNVIYVEYDGAIEINGELLYNYNNYLMYNDSSSFKWLKQNQPYLLKQLITSYGYTKDKDVLKFVFHSTDFNNKTDVEDLLFAVSDSKYVLRKEILDEIRDVAYKGQEIESFSEVVDEDLYYTLIKIITKIASSKDLYVNPDKSIAILLNELVKSGITGAIDSFLNNNSSFLNTLETNHFYDLKRLKEYVTILYENQPTIKKALVTDSDGFTNLRAASNSKSDIIQQVKKDEYVEILEFSGDWILVKTKENNTGYVHKTKVTIK